LNTIDKRTVGIPKQNLSEFPFGASSVMDWLADNNKDDIWGGLGSMRTFMAVQHKELMNEILTRDVQPIGLPADLNVAQDVFSDWDEYAVEDTDD